LRDKKDKKKEKGNDEKKDKKIESAKAEKDKQISRKRARNVVETNTDRRKRVMRELCLAAPVRSQFQRENIFTLIQSRKI
jgi:hypothetical protein